MKISGIVWVVWRFLEIWCHAKRCVVKTHQICVDSLNKVVIIATEGKQGKALRETATRVSQQIAYQIHGLVFL
ncbi:MAG: hypothetical protein C4297_02425 [Gemmataceae bacterium]